MLWSDNFKKDNAMTEQEIVEEADEMFKWMVVHNGGWRILLKDFFTRKRVGWWNYLLKD